MASENVDPDDEWEYEYSTTETETFYVDVDLSSMNSVIRSQNAGERKSLKRPAKVAAAAAGEAVDEALLQTADDTTMGEIQGTQDPGDNAANVAEVPEQEQEDETVDNANSPERTMTTTTMPIEPSLLDHDDDEGYTGRIQILDLDTTNPIISHNGQVYSCTWHDMLGTTLFVSKHHEAPLHEPEVSTEDYDLIGTTRVKLVGQRGRAIPRVKVNNPKKRGRGGKEGDESESDEMAEAGVEAPGHGHGHGHGHGTGSGVVPQRQGQHFDGKSLGSIIRTNPRTNVEIKQQANFLERLMEVKKSRGETDTVRTFVDRRTVAADARQARKAKRSSTSITAQGKEKEKEKRMTAEQRLRKEISELNKRVVQGDNDALERLQEIYADMEEVEDDEDALVFMGSSAADTTYANHRGSTVDAIADEPPDPSENYGVGGGGA